MKKIRFAFVWMWCASMCMLVCSCGWDVKDDDTPGPSPTPTDYVSVVNYDKGNTTFSIGKIEMQSFISTMSSRPYDTCVHVNQGNGIYYPCIIEPTDVDDRSKELTLDKVQYLTDYYMKVCEDNEDLLAIKNERGFASDFMYESNGEPLQVSPLFSGCLDDDVLFLYYIDTAGEYHQINFWNTGYGNGETPGTWKCKEGHIQGNDYISTNGDGFEMTLPKGTLFGFGVCDASRSWSRHFSLKEYNTRFPVKNALYNDECSAIQFEVKYGDTNYHLLGFEDKWSIEGSDMDFNDVVIAMSPAQTVKNYDGKDIYLTVSDAMNLIALSDGTSIDGSGSMTKHEKDLLRLSNEALKIHLHNLDDMQWRTTYDGPDYEISEITVSTALYAPEGVTGSNFTKDNIINSFGLKNTKNYSEWERKSDDVVRYRSIKYLSVGNGLSALLYIGYDFSDASKAKVTIDITIQKTVEK
ncbi:MAG: hypothetical protein HUK08_06100 [Bacteroidaceae bacterium]|nr:hypothetical protein [Bacteroidaceae bacterium]